MMGKIVNKETFPSIRARLRNENKKIVLCHGVFDLVHIGHLAHFEEAKKYGDVLVVTITAAEYTRKGPDRPYFSDEHRLKYLSALSLVDYVMLSEHDTVCDVMEIVQPDFYAKGGEYANPEDDLTGKWDEEEEALNKHGGKRVFTNDAVVFSSSKLINQALPALPEATKKWLATFADKHDFNNIKDMVDSFTGLKVLVVGEVIIDEYIYCDIMGLMTKSATGYSAKYKSRETFLGGSLAVARHAAQFTSDVTVCAVIGNETEIHSNILNKLSKEVHTDFIYSKNNPTIVKTKFIVPNEPRNEYHKLFSLNAVPDDINGDSQTTGEEFCAKLKEMLPKFDVVIVCDFGHGLINEKAIALLQEYSKCLAVNCQTNSVNMGTNLITKYSRADIFTLDQKELKLAIGKQGLDEREQLKRLKKHFNTGEGFLTRGSSGAYVINKTGEMYESPAFIKNVQDTIGAGDAFFVMASLCGAVQASSEVSLFMSNAMGALATHIVGNRDAVEKINLLKFAKTLMTF